MFDGAWRVIARKELKDALRDRNAIMTVLIFPLFGPVMVYFMMNQIIDISTDVRDLNLSISGYEYATDLVDHLRQNGVEVRNFNANGQNDQNAADDINPNEEKGEPVVIDQVQIDAIKRAIDSRQVNYVLLVPRDFETRISRSQPANVELHYDSSRTRAGARMERVAQIINAWSRETATLRLMARGINPQVTEPVNLVRIDVASEQSRARFILNMIPMFTLMAAFICGIGVAVDATAGERERKSLEPLLVNPVARINVVVGKWLVAFLFSSIGLLLVTLLNLFVLQKIPLAQIGLVFQLGALELVGIIVTLLPIALLVTSMQIFVGMLARSFKEAQGYISILSLMPMFPFFINTFNDQGRELWMSFVPIYGQYMLLVDVVAGKTPPVLDFVLSAAVLTAFSALFLMGTARLFKQERIIFS